MARGRRCGVPRPERERRSLLLAPVHEQVRVAARRLDEHHHQPGGDTEDRGGQQPADRVADGGHELNDAALAVRALATSREPTRGFLGDTAGGAALAEIGLGDDLDLCAEVDRHDIVAEMVDQAITRAGV